PARTCAPRGMRPGRIFLPGPPDLRRAPGPADFEPRTATIATAPCVRCPTTDSLNIQDMSIVENRKAFHDYFIEERYEAGLALEGWEVKAIRAGRSNLKESYVVVKGGEVYLL